MSNRKLISPSIVTGIADAIRTKKGTTATIKVSELADEIASIPTGGMADSTKELVQVVSGVTPTDEISLNNGIASGVVDAPSVQSWADTRCTADGGTIKDGIAYVKALRGKSVKVAQLAKELSKSNYASGYSYTGTTAMVDGNFVVTGTNGTDFHSVTGDRFALNRTYCIIAEAKASVEISAKFRMFSSVTAAFTIGTSFAKYAAIIKPTTGTANIAFLLSSTASTLTIKSFMVFDLTEMGMESCSTADAFATAMGYASFADIPYYQFGTKVLNCKQKSVISYGRNIFTEETELGNLYPSGDSIGMERASATQIRSKYIACKPSQKYYVTTSDTIFIFSYDASKNYIATPIAMGDTLVGSAYRYDTANHGCGIFTTPSGCAYIRFYALASYGTTYKNDICFEEGNTAHDYEPHREADTLTLPTLTAFPHGLCSNGTTYDEVILSEGKAYKRIADDGTILDTPQEVTFTPCRAYYKASNNGQEVATADTATAPFTAEIGYKEPTATELANVLNA